MSIKIEDNATEVLRKAMLGHGIASEALAQKSGLDLASIRRLRKARASEETLRRLAPLLQLDSEKLLYLDRLFDSPVREPRLPDSLLRCVLSCSNKVLPDMTANAYILADYACGNAVVFDCGMDAQGVIECLRERTLTPTALCLTHAHFDHADGRYALLRAFPETAVFDFSSLALNDTPSCDFSLGKFRLRAISVPGHTDDSVVFVCENPASAFPPIAFTGDTLFLGSLGGCLPDDLTISIENIRTRLLEALPEATIVAPGHGPLTTLAAERRHNPFF